MNINKMNSNEQHVDHEDDGLTCPNKCQFDTAVVLTTEILPRL